MAMPYVGDMHWSAEAKDSPLLDSINGRKVVVHIVVRATHDKKTGMSYRFDVYATADMTVITMTDGTFFIWPDNMYQEQVLMFAESECISRFSMKLPIEVITKAFESELDV